MNSEGQQRSAVKLLPVIDFSDTMQEKNFKNHFSPLQEKILLPLGNFGCFFSCYPNWEVRSTRIYKKLLKLSYYDHTNGKFLSVSTSLHGFLLACSLHNLMDPGSNPVDSPNFFFTIFKAFLIENLRFFACNIYLLYIL